MNCSGSNRHVQRTEVSTIAFSPLANGAYDVTLMISLACDMVSGRLNTGSVIPFTDRQGKGRLVFPPVAYELAAC